MSRIMNKSTVVIAALLLGSASSAFAYDPAPAAQASGSAVAAPASNAAQQRGRSDLAEHSSAQDGTAERPAVSSRRWRVTPSDPFKDHGT